jgi:hypothetical protein
MVKVAAPSQVMALLLAKRMADAPRSIVELALSVSAPERSSTTVVPTAPRKVPPARSIETPAPN